MLAIAVKLAMNMVLIELLFVSIAYSAEFQSDFISVETRGVGPDILLLHGFACSSDVWKGVVEEFNSRFRLHLVQVAGLAGIPAPNHAPQSYLTVIHDEIVRYIKATRLHTPILIGHSMGGLLSLLVGSKSPSSVGTIIVVDSLPFFSLLINPFATSEQVLPHALAWEKQILTMDDTQFEKQAQSSISILTKVQGKKDLLLKWSKASDRKAYAQMIREIMIYDARTELTKIMTPVIVSYAYDKAMPVSQKQLQQLYVNSYANLKDVRLQPVADSFHFIMWDQPEKVYKNLEQILSAASETLLAK